VTAFGVVTRDQIACAAAGPRLQVSEIGLHTRDLSGDLAALGWRLRAKEQKLAIAAAERAGVGPGSPKFGALPLDGGLRAARPAARGDRLLQAGAFGILRHRDVATERRRHSRERGQSQNPASSQCASHACVRRLHLVNRPCALCDSPMPTPFLGRAPLETGIAA
jgi:hypothetical protein